MGKSRTFTRTAECPCGYTFKTKDVKAYDIAMKLHNKTCPITDKVTVFASIGCYNPKTIGDFKRCEAKTLEARKLLTEVNAETRKEMLDEASKS